MRLALALGLALICASSYAADDAIAAKAREVLQEVLNDADSAKFLGLERNDKCIWGKVNAKNAHGGYVGFKKFTVTTPAAGESPQYVETGPGSVAYLGMCVSKAAAFTKCVEIFANHGVEFCDKYKE